MITKLRAALIPFVMTLMLLVAPAAAEPPAARIGVVVMHGKGGAPGGLVATLAAGLERRGHLVINLEMPWSGRRAYDVDVAGGESEVVAALGVLRRQGADRLFVAGHSQGGVFALYFGTRRHPVDGIIAIAPGGNVANALFRDKLGASVAQARQLVADGKGGEAARFLDIEGRTGTAPVVTTPTVYLTWFDPDGAMNQSQAVRDIDPRLPVLYLVPTRDYPALLRAKQPMFDALPPHPLTRLHEPDADHVGAPSASLELIDAWLAEVANAARPRPDGIPESPR